MEKLGYINDLLQDDQGFLWIAAIQGLAKYDGYSLKYYFQDATKPQSLAHNWVKSLLLDSANRLWAITHEGLCQFLPDEDNFDCATLTTPKNTEQKPTFYSLFEDHQGVYWASTSQGLKIFNPDSGEFSKPRARIAKALLPIKNSEANFVIDTIEEDENTLWFALIGNGLIRYNRNTDQLIHFKANSQIPHSLTENKITDLFLDSKKQLWISTLGGGLNYFNADTQNFKVLNYSDAEKSDTVWSVLEDSRGFLWIGDGTGVHIHDPQTGNKQHYPYIEGEGGIGNFVVRKIYLDPSDNFWLGYFPSGVDIVDMLASQFLNFHHKENETNSLANGGVLSTLEDKHGNLWIGCGFGLTYLERKTGQFTRYAYEENQPESLSGSTVLDIAQPEDGKLWLGAWDRGLNYFSIAEKKFKRYMEDPGDPTSLLGREPWAIHLDKQGRLWVGTEKGVNLYEAESGNFRQLMPRDEKGEPIKNLYVRDIISDKRGRVWVASFQGLYELDPDSEQYLKHYQHEPNNSGSISSNQLLTLHEDKRGDLWIGTQRGGLNLFKRERAEFIHFNEENGLPHMTVSSIVDDREGNIWVSTYQGLARLNREKNTFTSIDERHGPVGNLYNGDTASLLSTGELVFGSSRGLSIFNPENIKENTHVPQVVITGFSVFNKSVLPGKGSPIRRAINQAREVRLKYKQSVFSFEFAALDFKSPDENSYAYRLLGFENQWNEVGIQRTATYTNLDPGRYVFQVKASNNTGTWNPVPKSIDVYIKPPLWRSVWAYLLYFLILLAASYQGVKIYRSKLEFERKKLEQERAIVKSLKEIDLMKDEINRELDQKVAERTEELRREHEQLLSAQQELKMLNRKLENVSVTDPLTGLKNRRFLYQTINSDIATLKRKYAEANITGSEKTASIPGLTFILVDIDNFKHINDRHGHSCGDSILVQFSNLLKSKLRESDFVVRWGGEEFIIVMRYLPKHQAISSIQRVFEEVGQHGFHFCEENSLQLTCSMGVASYPFYTPQPQAISWEQVINIADAAMYSAKHSGRNCWVSLESASKIIEPEKFIESLQKGMIKEEINLHRLNVSSSRDESELSWNQDRPNPT